MNIYSFFFAFFVFHLARKMLETALSAPVKTTLTEQTVELKIYFKKLLRGDISISCNQFLTNTFH